MNHKRLVIGMSGASGAIYGIRLLELLGERPDVETHLVVSRAARLVIGWRHQVLLSDETLAMRTGGVTEIAIEPNVGLMAHLHQRLDNPVCRELRSRVFVGRMFSLRHGRCTKARGCQVKCLPRLPRLQQSDPR